MQMREKMTATAMQKWYCRSFQGILLEINFHTLRQIVPAENQLTQE
jgi:hypothetical protein